MSVVSNLDVYEDLYMDDESESFEKFTNRKKTSEKVSKKTRQDEIRDKRRKRETERESLMNDEHTFVVM